MYSFTHTNIVFLFRHLPTEIVIFINVCYQMKCFSGNSFSFLRAGFADIPPTFLISCEVQTRHSKTLKYSEQYIRGHLPGTKVSICICSEHDAIFNFSCLALCYRTNSFSLSYQFYHKNHSPCTMHASEISVFKVFMNACKLTGKMLIDWTFFLGV